MLSLTPSAAYASPNAKPAAINAVVPRRAFFICLSLVLVQADASTGPPETLRPLERPKRKVRNSPSTDGGRKGTGHAGNPTGIGIRVKPKSPAAVLFPRSVAKMPHWRYPASHLPKC